MKNRNLEKELNQAFKIEYLGFHGYVDEDLQTTKDDIVASKSELNQNKNLYKNVFGQLHGSQNEVEKYYLDSESYNEIIEENHKQFLRVKEMFNRLMKKSNSIEKNTKLNSNILKNSINFKLKNIQKKLNIRLSKN